MHDGLKIGISAGVAGTAVGLALQNTHAPMLQTIGQGWMLGGVAATALLGGIVALSAKWKAYNQERDLELSIEKLERHVAWPHSDNVSDHFHEVASQGIGTLMDAAESKKTAFMRRMSEITVAWARGQNTPETHEAAATSALLALGGVAWDLNVPCPIQAEDLVYVPQDQLASVLDAAQITTRGVSSVQGVAPMFKPAPNDENSVSGWMSNSPSLG